MSKAFQFTEQHIHEYYHLGITVLRGLLPASLIRDLRRSCDEGASAVRESRPNDRQVQRFQPVNKYVESLQPFQDYAELPELREAIDRLLSPAHIYADPEIMGVLIEPQGDSWRVPWHRDARAYFAEGEDEEWTRMLFDYSVGNQVNCALYEDSSTWYVPGSHFRDNLPRETSAVHYLPSYGRAPETDEERELASLEYCSAMPAAVCLHLSPGDMAIYRPHGLHLGNYVPYRKRATLHDVIGTPEAVDRWTKFLVQKEMETKAQAG